MIATEWYFVMRVCFLSLHVFMYLLYLITVTYFSHVWSSQHVQNFPVNSVQVWSVFNNFGKIFCYISAKIYRNQAVLILFTSKNTEFRNTAVLKVIGLTAFYIVAHVTDSVTSSTRNKKKQKMKNFARQQYQQLLKTEETVTALYMIHPVRGA